MTSPASVAGPEPVGTARPYIAVGIDFREPSIAALRWTARHIACDAEIVLAHALYVPQPPSFLRGLYPANDQLIEDAQRGAELRLRELSGSLGIRRAWPEIRSGHPAEVLAQVASEYRAELLVIGAHGERPGVWDLLGGTAERVTRRVSTSVLLARGLPPARPRTIVVALDESELNGPMLDWAARLGSDDGARVIVMHVVNPMMHGAVLVAASDPERRRAEAQLKERGERWLAGQIAGTPLEDAGIEVAFGDPGFAILAAVDRFDADMLLIGRHGSARASGSSIGGTAEFLLRRGSGPVMVVAEAAAKEGRA